MQNVMSRITFTLLWRYFLFMSSIFCVNTYTTFRRLAASLKLNSATANSGWRNMIIKGVVKFLIRGMGGVEGKYSTDYN
jgi:hypothetical protein